MFSLLGRRFIENIYFLLFEKSLADSFFIPNFFRGFSGLDARSSSRATVSENVRNAVLFWTDKISTALSMRWYEKKTSGTWVIFNTRIRNVLTRVLVFTFNFQARSCLTAFGWLSRDRFACQMKPTEIPGNDRRRSLESSPTTRCARRTTAPHRTSGTRYWFSRYYILKPLYTLAIAAVRCPMHHYKVFT